jgi:magnesium transporter
MISYYLRTIQHKFLKKTSEFEKGCLIYCVEPTDDDLEILKNQFLINEDLLKDALDPYEIPRAEKDGEKVYIFLRAPFVEKEKIFTTPILIVVAPEFFLFFSQNRLDFFEKFLRKEKYSIYTTQKTKLFIQILSKIGEVFKIMIVKINREVRRAVFEIKEIQEEEIRKLIKFEVILQDFLSTLVSTRITVTNLLQKQYIELFPADRKLIEDFILDLNQLEEMSKSSVKNIINLREGHQIIFTNTINKIIKILTSYTIIISIPMVIASIYGMNIRLPLETKPIAFSMITIFSLILMFIVFLIFKWKKWL